MVVLHFLRSSITTSIINKHHCFCLPMAVYNPQHPDTLQRQLQHADTHLLVVCFCAAWCDTCNAYESDFQTLAQQRPSATFIWVDIKNTLSCLVATRLRTSRQSCCKRASTLCFLASCHRRSA